MITINKSSSNDVVVTLTEKVTTVSVDYFLFVFTHVMTGELKKFTATNISTAVGRYDEFTIIDNSTEDPYNGKMNFREGFHEYVIYNMPSSSPISLDPNDAIEIVEVGKVTVIGTANETKYFDPGYSKDYTVWNG